MVNIIQNTLKNVNAVVCLHQNIFGIYSNTNNIINIHYDESESFFKPAIPHAYHHQKHVFMQNTITRTKLTSK